jgi:hypothetical protein
MQKVWPIVTFISSLKHPDPNRIRNLDNELRETRAGFV